MCLRRRSVVTAELFSVTRDPAARLQRPDVVRFPFGGMTLVIVKPSFAAY